MLLHCLREIYCEAKDMPTDQCVDHTMNISPQFSSGAIGSTKRMEFDGLVA